MKGNLIKARVFAATKHSGQLDDDENDYYMHHLVPVCEALIILTNDEEILMAGVLHDVLEDTDTTYEELVKEFGKRVADLVNEVTDEGEADSYGKYFPRLKSKEAIMIKLIDRASNVSRMNSWHKERQDHYLKKTKFWKDGHDIVKDFSKAIDKSGLRGKKYTPSEPSGNVAQNSESDTKTTDLHVKSCAQNDELPVTISPLDKNYSQNHDITHLGEKE